MSIEWSDPVPGELGPRKKPCMEIHGLVNGEHRFTVQYIDDRVAVFLDRKRESLFFQVSGTPDEEYGSHVDQMKAVAEHVLQGEGG